MRDLPTGTITLLFTDIEGSTHLLQRLGERYAELLNECRTLLRTAFHTYHGQEVDAQGTPCLLPLLAPAMPSKPLWPHSENSPSTPGQVPKRFVCAWGCRPVGHRAWS